MLFDVKQVRGLDCFHLFTRASKRSVDFALFLFVCFLLCFVHSVPILLFHNTICLGFFLPVCFGLFSLIDMIHFCSVKPSCIDSVMFLGTLISFFSKRFHHPWHVSVFLLFLIRGLVETLSELSSL